MINLTAVLRPSLLLSGLFFFPFLLPDSLINGGESSTVSPLELYGRTGCCRQIGVQFLTNPPKIRW